ncbi:hypothetical protein ACFFGH_10720 [Lysobacter korlensis]|uniref:Uncharacterized protein n=1 Tax=Lysobacter korlensis TaxID=553636 RepID=A0ABV6RQW8_9GAMM
MDLNFTQLFFEGAVVAAERAAEAIAANPWPYIGITALAIAGALVPKRGRRATYRR